MPSLGADMEAGVLSEWLIKPGDRVERGDVVAVVETQKGAIDIEIYLSGEVEKLLVPEGEKVPVGTALAVIRVPGEEAAPTAKPAVAGPPAVKPQPTPIAILASPPGQGRTRSSPAARKRAAELGLDLTALTGTGPGGVVTLADVEGAGKASRPEAAFEGQAAMRQAIAAAMARSKREIPHYYLGSSVDMSQALDWLQAYNEQRPVTERLLYAVLLVKAVALALREVPELNGFWREGAFRASEDIHAGMAISLRGGGLVAPALLHADARSLEDLMAGFRDLVQRARTVSLRSSEMSAATVTISSLGERSVDSVFGIIYPPQVALVGFGRIGERPWSVAGRIVSRPLIQVSLAADHRASDGHRGAHFLNTVERLLREPEKLT